MSARESSVCGSLRRYTHKSMAAGFKWVDGEWNLDIVPDDLHLLNDIKLLGKLMQQQPTPFFYIGIHFLFPFFISTNR